PSIHLGNGWLPSHLLFSNKTGGSNAHSSLASGCSHSHYSDSSSALALGATMSSFTSTEAGLRLRARSGLSWGAIFGGAVAATAITVMLAAAGSAFGLAWVSPTSADNPSPVTFTVVAAIWLIIVQWIASFFG